MNGRRILVSGITGFIGPALAKELLDRDIKFVGAYRNTSNESGFKTVPVGDINETTDWSGPLREVGTVVHLAARVHIMNDHSDDPLREFRAVNVDGTLNLARQAAEAGVKRFIFLSSIKVNGEQTSLGWPFTPDDTPAPTDPYGISKLEAEQGLMEVAKQTGMEVVIIRPVLVYGPGVKANFRSMMALLNKRMPLPLGKIKNKRSLVALDNLVDLIITCIDHPAAANEIFLVSDGEDLSTPDLLRRTGDALGEPARLLPVPEGFLYAGASLLGKRHVAQRLCSSLQVDISKTRELLGWMPPVSVNKALRDTAQDFLKNLEK